MLRSRRTAGLRAVVATMLVAASITPLAFAAPDPTTVEIAQSPSPQLEALVKRLNDLGIKNGNQPFTIENATRATALHMDNRVWQQLTDEDMTALLLLTRLTHIDVGPGKVTTAGMAQLAKLPELYSLGLYGLVIDDKLLEALASAPRLAHLNLGSTRGVTDAGLAHVAKIKHLKWLTLDRVEISDAGLAALSGCKTLERLSLQQMPKVTDEGLKHVAALPNLQMLSLNFTRINTGLEHLTASKSLQQISLMNTAVDDQGAAHLAGIPTLRRLFIWGTAITDASMKAIGTLTNLETLYLNRTKITDKGLEELKNLKQLKTLWLSETAVGDAGMAALTDLPLAGITIDDTQVGDAGLAILTKIPTLHTLNARKSKITDAGVVDARKALPKLKITR